MTRRPTSLELLVVGADRSAVERIADALRSSTMTESVRTRVVPGPDGYPDHGADGVVLTDRAIEALDGAVQAIGEADPPAVLLAGSDRDEAVATAVEAGVTDVFPKVETPEQYELISERIAANRSAGMEAPGDGDTGPDGRGALDEADETTDPDTSPTVFEAVGDGLVLHDVDTGEILDVNTRFCEMHGYDREELLGEDIGIIMASGREYRYERVRDTLMETPEGGRQLIEWRNQRRSGETFPVEVHVRTVRTDGEEQVLASVRDITERKRREREYEQIFNAVNDSIVVHDPDTGRMVDANESFCELVGYDRETVLELGTPGLSVEEDGYTEERAREIIDRVMREGSVDPFRWKVETSDGHHRLLEVNATRAEIGGEPRHVSLMRDVTEHRNLEETYREVFDKSAATITVHDPGDPTLQDANQTLCEMLGYEREELIGMDPLRITPDIEGYDADRVETVLERAVEREDPVTVEWPLETKDGEVRWIETSLTTARLEGELRILSTGREITEAKRRERDYEEIFEAVDDGIGIFDPETLEIIDANDAYLEMLGYEDFETFRERGVEGLSATDEGFTVERGRRIHTRVADTGDPETVEWLGRTKDGERRWVESHVTPAVIGGDEVTIAINRDITERKRREEAIQALERATDEILTAETPRAVAETVVGTAGDVLNASNAACWLRSSDGSGLEPAATAGEATEQGSLPTLSPGDPEYATFERGEVETYTADGDGPDLPFETGLLLPLGEHGLLGIGQSERDRSDGTLLDVADALVDHATTALDRVERAQEVRESERRFRLIADRVEEVLYLAKPDFSELLYINPAYEEVWGQPREALRTDPTAFMDRIDPRDRGGFEADFEGMLDDMDRGEPQDSYEFEFRIEHPDGDVRWVSAMGYPVELASGERRFVGIAQDVTDRKRREQRLRVFNRVLRHDLRNQLDVVKSHAEALAESTETPHPDRIIEAADRLTTISTRARMIDRIMSGEPRPTGVDVARLARETVEAVNPDGGGVRVRTELPETAPVNADRETLRTVLRTAIEDGVRYADSTVTVRVDPADGGCVFEVVDDGPGIPEEELEALQEGTETDLRHGRGIGLWQLKWGTDRLGGDLSFDTSDGTTVRVELSHTRETSN